MWAEGWRRGWGEVAQCGGTGAEQLGSGVLCGAFWQMGTCAGTLDVSYRLSSIATQSVLPKTVGRRSRMGSVEGPATLPAAHAGRAEAGN